MEHRNSVLLLCFFSMRATEEKKRWEIGHFVRYFNNAMVFRNERNFMPISY